LVVSIAATVPQLTSLTLDRITRSSQHAPDLLGKIFYVPLVASDSDIPSHPTLGDELSLPSVLRIPTLESLSIRDTHLGDPRWATTEAMCTLKKVELGSCMHVPPEDDATAYVLAAIGDSVSELTISSPSITLCSNEKESRLSKLRRLTVSEYFPPTDVVDTLNTLKESPIERLDLACFEMDVPDVCDALEEFFEVRKLEDGLHCQLKTVSVMLQDADPDVRLRRKLSDICGGVSVRVKGVSSVFEPDVRVRGRAMTV
jgi:hypothetical protein